MGKLTKDGISDKIAGDEINSYYNNSAVNYMLNLEIVAKGDCLI